MAKQKFHTWHNGSSINIFNNKLYLYRRYLGSKIKYGTSLIGFNMLVLGLLCRHISFFIIHTVSCQDTSFFFFNWILATTTWAPDLDFRAHGTLNLIDLYDLGQFYAKASSMFYIITIVYISPYAVGTWILFVLCKSDPLKRCGQQVPVKWQPLGLAMK